MAKFKITTSRNDNSNPVKKIGLRKTVAELFTERHVLDIYGGNGVMYRTVWCNVSDSYAVAGNDAISWLKLKSDLHQNIYDIDPYASPFEAIEIICEKSIPDRIAITCTDGYLRRCAMMRTHFNKYIQHKTGWPDRDLTLMAAIYHQYPSFLRYLLSRIIHDYEINKLFVKYGSGTWNQATVYFAAILSRTHKNPC